MVESSPAREEPPSPSPLRLWRWLTAPHSSQRDPIERQQSRLLSGLLLALITTSLLYDGLNLLLNPAFAPTFLWILGTIGLLTGYYVLNRWGRYRLAARLTLITLSLSILISVVIGATPENLLQLFVVVMPVLLGSMLLPFWETALLAAGNLLGMLLLAALAPQISAGLIVVPFGFVLAMSALILVAIRHRDSLEARRQAELTAQEARYRAVVEDQTELICRFRPDGTITFVNEAYCRYFGKPPEGLIDHSFLSLMSSEEWAKFQELIDSLGPENPAVTVEHRSVLPSGESRWVQWTQRAILDHNERLIEVQSVGRDITERVQAEEALRRQSEQLRALAARLEEIEEAERRQLARELHDQVGQGLTALSINLNLIREELSPESAARADGRLADSLTLLEELGKRIRDVMANLRPAVLDDYGLLAALRWYGDRVSARTGLKVVVEGDEEPHLPSVVETTLFRIAQEALNNAVKHAQASRVIVALERKDNEMHLTITDDGVGFDLRSPRRPGAEGGWGVLTMRERALAVDGNLHIESQPGEGTRVVVQVPFTPE